MSFANGKYAYGYCDLTGFRYPLKDLKPQIVNGIPTGLLFGKDVWSPDQPQLHLGRVRVDDPQALRNPRPDQSMEESRALFGFDPVGNDAVRMEGQVGIARVTTS